MKIIFLPHTFLQDGENYIKETFFSTVATVVFNMRLLHAVAFSNQLPWFEPTNAIYLKTQPHAVNACKKRSSQRGFRHRRQKYPCYKF